MPATVPALRVAINGFGRIGRYTAKLLLKNPDFNLVAINDLADPAAIAHLLKYDSVHGKFEANISHSPGLLNVDDQKIALFSESNPENLPWKTLTIDLVFECTGRFTLKKDAEKHLKACAKKVIISAPPSPWSFSESMMMCFQEKKPSFPTLPVPPTALPRS
jgi:glyceraldehyde 3-phosphate dehydrogenase